MKSYIDVDMKFTMHPVTKDVSKKSGVRAVQQSVRNLVMTSLDDWETAPEIGAGVYKLLGENATATLQVDTENKIVSVLAAYETRAEVETVDVALTEDLHGMMIKIVFYVVNNSDPVTETIWLKRVN